MYGKYKTEIIEWYVSKMLNEGIIERTDHRSAGQLYFVVELTGNHQIIRKLGKLLSIIES